MHAASKTQSILVISSDCPLALGDYSSIKVAKEALLNFTFYFRLVTDEKLQFSFFNISTVLAPQPNSINPIIIILIQFQ